MSHFFVTGIGTGVGKTLISASLLHQSPGYTAIKPVLSGFNPDDAAASDAGILQQAMHRNGILDEISPWRFRAPLSPHLAAAKEGKVIEPQKLLDFCREQMNRHPNLLIEGVGGLMVPVTPRWLVLDWVKALNVPVILVAASYLGAINHTLLTYHMLAQENITVNAIIVSEAEPEQCAGLEDTKQSLESFIDDTPVFVLPRIPSETPWKDAPDLLSLIT